MTYERMMEIQELARQYGGLGTLQEMEAALKCVDWNCKVHEHPTVPFAVQIIPSSNEYRDALRAVAESKRCVGVAVSVCRIAVVDDFGPAWGEPRKVSKWKRIIQYFQKISRLIRK